MAGNMIKITDYDKVTPTKDDTLLINQNGSNRKTTVNDLIGDVNTLSTTNKTIVGSINENNASLNDKVNKSNVINDCSTTEEGFVLDGRQGKYLNDKINNTNVLISLPQHGEQRVLTANTKYGDLFEWTTINKTGLYLILVNLNTDIFKEIAVMKNETVDVIRTKNDNRCMGIANLNVGDLIRVDTLVGDTDINYYMDYRFYNFNLVLLK